MYTVDGQLLFPNDVITIVSHEGDASWVEFGEIPTLIKNDLLNRDNFKRLKKKTSNAVIDTTSMKFQLEYSGHGYRREGPAREGHEEDFQLVYETVYRTIESASIDGLVEFNKDIVNCGPWRSVIAFTLTVDRSFKPEAFLRDIKSALTNTDVIMPWYYFITFSK